MTCPTMLRMLLQYNPETGSLTWKKRLPFMFRGGNYPAERRCNKWNAVYPGREAFSPAHGYMVGRVMGTATRAHRVAWAIVHGAWPAGIIDHINGDRQDNRLSNLRVVTDAENARNQKVRKNNKSGTMGVRFDRHVGKWIARIGSNGSRQHIGAFETKEDAVAARLAAQCAAGFHENHGART